MNDYNILFNSYAIKDILKSFLAGFIFFILISALVLVPTITILLLYVPFMLYFFIFIFVALSLAALYTNKLWIEALQTYLIKQEINYRWLMINNTIFMSLMILTILVAVYININ